MINWSPWGGMLHRPAPGPIKVDGPPCKFCKHWKPVSVWKGDDKPYFDGVRLCHAPDQYHDFSCFKKLYD